MRAAAAAIVAFLLGASSPASAGTIRLVGEPELETVVEGDTVHVTGRFEMKNEGNETAREVFPAVELGGWGYVGKPHDIGPNQQFSWEIDGRLTLDQLSCGTDPMGRCAGLDLPKRGAFPLFARKHYQDLNGKPFSAPLVRTIFVGDLTDDERARVQVSSIEGASTITPDHPLWGPNGLDIRGEQTVFHAAVKVRNLSPQERKVAISLHMTREFETNFLPQALSLGGAASGEVEAELGNASALPGSAYPVSWVLQWDDGGLRGATQVYGMAEVNVANRLGLVVGIAVTVVAVLGALLWWVLMGGTRR